MIWWILGVLAGSTFVVYFWLIVGVAADFVFNHTRGCLEFREGPRGVLFTQRVQYHVGHSAGWRYERALRWAYILNAVDDEHIRL
jgi:hypothetical protein